MNYFTLSGWQIQRYRTVRYSTIRNRINHIYLRYLTSSHEICAGRRPLLYHGMVWYYGSVTYGTCKVRYRYRTVQYGTVPARYRFAIILQYSHKTYIYSSRYRTVPYCNRTVRYRTVPYGPVRYDTGASNDPIDNPYKARVIWLFVLGKLFPQKGRGGGEIT